MADKLLPGTSKEAWSFLCNHWKSLVKVSALPFLIYFAVTFLVSVAQIIKLRPSGAAIQIGYIAQWDFVERAGSYFIFAILLWMSLTVFKYYNNGKPTRTGIYTALSKGVFLAFMYVAVCILISGVGLLPSYLADNFIAVETKQAFSFNIQVFVSMLLHFLIVVASLALALYLFCRPIAGLEVVFREGHWDWNTLQVSWASTKGESFGLPARLVAWALVTSFGIGLFTAISHLFVVASQMEGKSWLSLLFSQPNFGLEIAEKLLPLKMALVFLHLPIVWFFSLLLAVSGARFFGKSKKLDNKFEASNVHAK